MHGEAQHYVHQRASWSHLYSRSKWCYCTVPQGGREGGSWVLAWCPCLCVWPALLLPPHLPPQACIPPQSIFADSYRLCPCNVTYALLLAAIKDSVLAISVPTTDGMAWKERENRSLSLWLSSPFPPSRYPWPASSHLIQVLPVVKALSQAEEERRACCCTNLIFWQRKLLTVIRHTPPLLFR